VKLRVELTPNSFVQPLEVSSINTSVVPRCVVPRNAKRPIAARKRARKNAKLQNVAEVACILITHRLPRGILYSFARQATLRSALTLSFASRLYRIVAEAPDEFFERRRTAR
jgi:hypothetical protein